MATILNCFRDFGHCFGPPYAEAEEAEEAKQAPGKNQVAAAREVEEVRETTARVATAEVTRRGIRRQNNCEWTVLLQHLILCG